MIPTDVYQAVGTLGFPIAMCLLMWYDKRTTQRELKEAVINNTNALTIMEVTLRGMKK